MRTLLAVHLFLIVLVSSCSIAWGDAKKKWEKPFLDGQLCYLYEECNSKAVSRGYGGQPRCQLHMDSLALYTLLSPEEAEKAIEEGKSPQMVVQEINNANNWANSVQNTEIGYVGGWQVTPPTIVDLQKEVDLLKTRIAELERMPVGVPQPQMPYSFESYEEWLIRFAGYYEPLND